MVGEYVVIRLIGAPIGTSVEIAISCDKGGPKLTIPVTLQGGVVVQEITGDPRFQTKMVPGLNCIVVATQSGGFRAEYEDNVGLSTDGRVLITGSVLQVLVAQG